MTIDQSSSSKTLSTDERLYALGFGESVDQITALRKALTTNTFPDDPEFISLNNPRRHVASFVIAYSLAAVINTSYLAGESLRESVFNRSGWLDLDEYCAYARAELAHPETKVPVAAYFVEFPFSATLDMIAGGVIGAVISPFYFLGGFIPSSTKRLDVEPLEVIGRDAYGFRVRGYKNNSSAPLEDSVK